MVVKITFGKLRRVSYHRNFTVVQFHITYLKNSQKVKPYPCCSAIPAHSTLAEAPIIVPLPVKINMPDLYEGIYKKYIS